MSESQPWTDLIEYSERTDGLLAKTVYVVFSNRATTIEAIQENLDEHVDYQKELHRQGVMFAAGPLPTVDETQWGGNGMFVYLAGSYEDATKLADADPMHARGARTYTIAPWLLNEGISTEIFALKGLV